MKYIFILIFCESAIAVAISPFDFVEASRKLNALDRLNGSSGKKSRTPTCERIDSNDGENSFLSCAVTDSDYDVPILKAEFEPGQIPKELQSWLPIKFASDTEDKKVSCLFRSKFQNDNLSPKDGRKRDDYGATHKSEFGVSCMSSDGVSSAFIYSTDLYTKPDLLTRKQWPDGRITMNQQFNSENTFAIIQDNIKQGKVTYYKRGFGFINFSEKEKWGLLQSTGQQSWAHHLLNKFGGPNTATEYTNIEGPEDRWGAFVTMAIGLQENRKLGQNCALSFRGDIGARVSTLKNANTLDLNLQGKISYNITNQSSLYLRVQSETVRRPSSLVTSNSLAAGVETNTGSFAEVGVTKQFGNRKDVYDSPNYWSKKNDSLFFLRMGRRF